MKQIGTETGAKKSIYAADGHLLIRYGVRRVQSASSTGISQLGARAYDPRLGV